MLTRRGLLAAGALTAAAAATTAGLAGCDPDPAVPDRVAPAVDFDPSNWDSVRTQFALDPNIANFTTFVFASHAASVRAAIAKHRDGLDRDPYRYLGEHELELEDAVARAAAGYLGTGADQIAFTDSTTMGLGLLYSGLRLAPGDEVLTTEHDFYSTHESLALRAARDGATVRRVRLYDESERADADQIVARLLAAVTPATKVVAITWVHSSTGVKLPVRRIADALDGPLLCVDGVHGFGIEDAGPAELGCDFLVTGTHKWLFGPRGTGLVWGRAEAWNRYTPVIPSFTGEDTPGRRATPGGYHSFEHRWALAEAFALHAAIGRTRVAERTHTLAAALKDGLAGIAKVHLRTPRDPGLSAGIVCCEVDGLSAGEAVNRLRAAKVHASPTPYTPSYLRFGPSILTTESDVDKALAAVRAL
jgi:selenocysteine lyase/cysteine desulfurase